MTQDFRIYPAWKDVMVYDEGGDHQLRLNCDFAGQIPYVSVATADRWVQETAQWAHGQRPLILGRLRATNCILCEVGEFTSTTFSPDGRLRIEVDYIPDVPFPPRREVRVVDQHSGLILASLPDAGMAGLATFFAAGVVLIPFQMRGPGQEIGIDAGNRNFWFPPSQDRLPLDQLSVAVTKLLPAPAALYRAPHKPGGIFKSVGTLLICIVAVGTGVWQAIAGKTMTDHLMGAVCVVFFGLCTLIPLSELRKMISRKKRP